MLRRSNKRKNQSDKSIVNAPETVAETSEKIAEEGSYESETISREELIQQSEDAKRVYEDIMRLRQSVAGLKQTGLEEITEEMKKIPDKAELTETEAIVAAKKAILEQAKKDALEEQAKREELLRKEEEARLERQKVLEAQRRAAMIEAEAEEKRRQAEEAERIAKEIERKVAFEAIEAERKAKEAREREEAARHEAAAVAALEAAALSHTAEADAFFEESRSQEIAEEELSKAKQELIHAQILQETRLDMMSNATEMNTSRLAAEQQEKLTYQQEVLKTQQQEVTEILEQQKEERIDRLTEEAKEEHIKMQRALEEKRKKEEKLEKARLEKEAKLARAKAEKEAKLARAQAEKAAKLLKLQEEKKAKVAKQLAMKEAKAEKLQAEREAKIAKALADREEKRIREEKKKLERQRKAEERELIKRARKDAEARALLERRRLEEKSKADAEIGGGIVNVQGLTINTEIKEVAHISWRDLFSLRSKKEKTTESANEKRKLERERKRRTEESRALLEFIFRDKRKNYENTAFAKKFSSLAKYCDKHKAALLSVFAIVLVTLVAAAGVANYYTAYAYSYNGKVLGFVKEKDDVLVITDMVQGALTEDKNVEVVINERKDIKFDRVWTGGDADIDTSEDVLKRLTYMGDLNVNAYCIFIEGKKVGAVESKEIAEEVFREIEENYTSGMEVSEVESIEIVEKWDGKEDKINLERVMSKDEMVKHLCTDVHNESVHEVIADETLADIAKLYSLTEEDILKSNPNVNKKNLPVGTKLVIEKDAPILTIKITEKVSYEKVIEHKVEKKDSKEIYEGYSETMQEGSDGLTDITSRITLVNGEQVEEKILESNVKKEAVTEIILVGVKERPPSVGSGKYIWPFESGYTLTSGFKWRWGRLHEGIDLGTPVGNNVLAADGGIVTFAGYSGGYGYLIKIDHQNGMETRYAHNSELLVKEGDKVFQGMHIAESGNSGRSTGPHLHFEIRVNGTAKDPLNYLP